jgi:hypothetical protein
VTPSAQGDDPSEVAACIAEVCAALQSEAHAEERTRLVASAAFGVRLLDARLLQIQDSLDRIEAQLGKVEHELAVLVRPSWPF